MKKNALKGFLIRNFLVILLGIYASEELISMFYRMFLFPVTTDILQKQQMTIAFDGNLFLFLVKMLLYFGAGLLPEFFSDAVRLFIEQSLGETLQISVNSPLLYGAWGYLLQILLLVYFFLLLLISLLPYGVGAFLYYRLVTKKVNELMEEEKERQKDFERQKNLLLSDIAHDIKTPLTTICGYSKALSDGVVEQSGQKAYLDAIYAKSMWMDDLITMLFEYVKLDSAGFTLHKEKTDLAELVRENAALLYPDLEQRGMLLEMDVPEEPVLYGMDKLQMGRAFTNLLTNAIRYGKENGKILVRLQGGALVVADDGEPIGTEFAEHIFEPFSREDKARSTKGGSGLGLSICSKIVEMHGGKLKLDVSFGEGYTKAFVIKL